MCSLAYFIVRGEISFYELMKIKVASITREMILYHFTVTVIDTSDCCLKQLKVHPVLYLALIVLPTSPLNIFLDTYFIHVSPWIRKTAEEN